MKRILIVDDEKEISQLLKKKLETNKYTVTTASTGQEALEVSKSGKPDLILMDIAIPGMDGYAVAGNLKKDKETRDIPIIFLTGKELDPKSISDRVGEIGAYDFIMKPCSMAELLEKIKAAIP